ncbi:MAG: FAD-dependent oxidoreductase [Thermodesulfobacteriota bacterium]|nr:FAD-dependent oxidoreductase [Thermodesulfobacteriota bacterium]
MNKKIVIIGAGPAGTAVALNLRTHGYTGTISMFSAEDTSPYSPAALGEYLIRNNKEVLHWHGIEFCKDNQIDYFPAEKVRHIKPVQKQIRTERDRTVEYDSLVIASGSTLFIPNTVKGADRQDILNFKNLSGAGRIKELAEKGNKSAVIVGGGFIGVEIALCLSKIGITPSVLNRRGWIMPRLLDPETSEYVVEDLKAQGVSPLLHTEGKRFIGNGRVTGIETVDGRILNADIFIAATGVRPNVDFLEGSGIDYDEHGIAVDAKLRTMDTNIYACGDVAKTIDLITGETKIHGLYPVAVNHGKTVALNILGFEQDYEKQFSMNSLKEFSFKIIVVGSLTGDEIKYKKNGVLRKVFLQDGKLNGFVLVRDIGNAGYLFSLLKKRKQVEKYGSAIVVPSFGPAYGMTLLK